MFFKQSQCYLEQAAFTNKSKNYTQYIVHFLVKEFSQIEFVNDFLDFLIKLITFLGMLLNLRLHPIPYFM